MSAPQFGATLQRPATLMSLFLPMRPKPRETRSSIVQSRASVAHGQPARYFADPTNASGVNIWLWRADALGDE